MQLDKLIIKYRLVENHRYNTLLILPIVKHNLDGIFTAFAAKYNAQVYDFEQIHCEEIGQFKTWQAICETLKQITAEKPCFVMRLGAFFNKWNEQDRIYFIQYIMRYEWKHPLVLLLYIADIQSAIGSIPENERGIVYYLNIHEGE